MDQIRDGREAGLTAAQIAEQLNEAGFRPASGEMGFNKGIVQVLLNRLGASRPRLHREKLPHHEWWLRDLAETLRTTEELLRHWIDNGWILAQALPLPILTSSCMEQKSHASREIAPVTV